MFEAHLVARARPALAWLLAGTAFSCQQIKSLPGVQPQSGARAPAPTITMGPWLLEEGDAKVSVAWVTEQRIRGRVFYGEQEARLIAEEPEARTEHRVPLQNLSAATSYFYRVEGAVPATGAFTTAPRADALQPFRVLIYGDNRTNSGDHALVVRAAAAERTAVALHTGDMVVNANEAPLWRTWFAEESDLLSRTPLVPTVGNHEMTDKGAAYSRYFQPPGLPAYRSFDYGPLHIVAVDSFEESTGAEPHAGGISAAQASWLEEDLKAVPKDRHLWVLVHQGPYAHPARQRPGHGGSARVRRVLAAAARGHAIEAVFAGHEHFYERGEIDGTHFFVVGGGGAPLEDPDPSFPGVQSAHKALSFLVVEVCGCHVSGQTKDIEGRVLDSFTLADCPQACPARPGSVSAAATSTRAPREPVEPAAAAELPALSPLVSPAAGPVDDDPPLPLSGAADASTAPAPEEAK